jgi:hypothetical protein
MVSKIADTLIESGVTFLCFGITTLTSGYVLKSIQNYSPCNFLVKKDYTNQNK